MHPCPLTKALTEAEHYEVMIVLLLVNATAAEIPAITNAANKGIETL